MARKPRPVTHPDDHFHYADDLTRLTGRDWVKVGVGSVLAFCGMLAFLCLLFLAGITEGVG